MANRRARRGAWKAWIVAGCGLLLATALAPQAAAQGQGGSAQITVTWSNGGMTVDITSTKGLSNVIIEDCEGEFHKHEFNGEDKTWQHTETYVIAGVWVKSGSNSDPNGPPGAGQRFDNPNADEQCDEDVCEGPASVAATAHEGPRNRVTWSAVADADTYNVYRAIGAGSFSMVGSSANTTFDDTDVQAGVTYRYQVTAVIDGQETDACATAEVTAIPDLPGVFAASMAAVGGLGAYALLRRRRAA